MGKIIEVMGIGPREFPDDMSDEQIAAILRAQFPPPAQSGDGVHRGRQGGYTPTYDSRDPGAPGYTEMGKATGYDPKADPEGATLSMFKETDAPVGSAREVAEDVLTQAGDALSFHQLDKLAAKINQWQGKGTYEENLARNRQQTRNSETRLGGPTAALAQLGGGIASGTALARMGLTALGRLAPAAPFGTKVAAGAAEGAAYGAAERVGATDVARGSENIPTTTDQPGYQPATAQDYLGNAWEGAKTGGIFGAAMPIAGRVVTPFPATPSRTRLVEGLENNGVNIISAGQRTGNSVLNYFEDITSKLPFGGNPSRGQMEQVTQAAMRRAGVQGTHATSDALDETFERVGGGIGAMRARYPAQYDNHMIQDLIDVSNRASVVKGSKQDTIHAYMDRILQPGSTVDPAAFSSLRTDLRLSLTKGDNLDPHFNRAINGMIDALDNSLERTIVAGGNRADAEAYNLLRRQYANLHVLTDAIGRSGARGEEGILTAAALKASLKKSLDPVQVARGRGDLNELASGSSGVLRGTKDSGTTTRANLDITKPIQAAGGPLGYVAVNNPMMQRYWGNQVNPSPGLLQGGIAGASGVGGSDMPLTDRIINGLLGMGR